MSNLFREYQLGSLALTEYPYSVRFGSDVGMPSDPDEPREITLTVGIEGADLLELAENEAALDRECGRDFNEIAITPGDGFSPTSIFGTTSISAKPVVYEDGGEQIGYREWELTIEADRHPRSSALTTATPLSVGGSPVSTVFDACNVDTGWTGQIDGVEHDATTFWEAGSVGVAVFDNPDGDADTIVLTRAGAVDFTGTPYLVVEARVFSGNKVMTVKADGVGLTLLNMRDMGSGHMEYTYLIPDVSVTTLSFTHTRPAADAWAGLLVYDLTKSNMPPGASSHQTSRTIPVSGTQRSPGSLRVSSPDGTTSLSLVVVHTQPMDETGNTPPLVSRRVQGNTITADANTFSGQWETTGPGYLVYDTPIQSMPQGLYQMMAFMRSSVAGPVVFDAVIQSRLNDVMLGEVVHSVEGGNPERTSFPLANDPKIVDLGLFSVPIVAAKAGEFRVLLRGPSTVQVDEVWLFRVEDDCGLTVLLAGEPHVWLDSPDASMPVPQVWEGTATDKADAHFPRNGIHTMGIHDFKPPSMSVFVGALGAPYPDVSITHYPRWHTHAAE